MNIKVVQETKPTLKNFGKYKLQVQHNDTIEQEEIEEEISANCSARPADVILVMTELMDVVSRHLKRGDRVRLKGLGLLKLEVESFKADTPQQLRVPDSIRNVRLHLIPESRQGHQRLYEGIKFKRV